MHAITMPYSGELLVAHLAAYGLVFLLDAAGFAVYAHHDPASLSFEPVVEFDAVGDPFEAAAHAIRASADEAADAVEADVETGKRGNDRRAVIWARASFANDPGKAVGLLRQRGTLLSGAEERDARVCEGLLAGLGAAAAWGPATLKPSQGSTVLDGVLGNHTSDMVRGVLRPARAAAAAVDAGMLAAIWADGPSTSQPDKTGWAPPGTPVDLVHQWCAVLGLCVLPVAHRPVDRSQTPACWSLAGPRRHGITLPLLARATSAARLRALVGLQALVDLGDHDPGSKQGSGPAAVLRSFGIAEAVAFERLPKRGSGTSVAFSFRRGRRLALR